MNPLLAKSSNDRPMLDVSHIIATTSNNVDGYRVRNYLGIVRGVIVREPKIMQGFKADLKGLVGGKIDPLIRMCDTARQQAYDAMLQKAALMEANAVIGVQYDSSSLNTGQDDIATEMCCYGTAVQLEPMQPQAVQSLQGQGTPQQTPLLR
jgi:uncharacterized protein YbjQ (UPF0145 family)